MITTEKAVCETRPNTKDASLLLSLVLVLFLATLTLWIPAYWPVALFEISAFTIAGIALVLKKRPGNGTHYPLFCLSFVVLWGCLQLITGWSVQRFATERATLQWMTWAAVYYAGVSISQDEGVAKRLRSVIVWFGFAVSVEAILQAYLSPGNAYGLFPTGYHDFVMGPIVYHTHFAAFIETILPLALCLALNEARQHYTYLGISAVLLAAVVVSASRGGLIIAFVEVLVVLVLLYRQKPKASKRLSLRVLVLVSVTAVLTLIVGFATASERFHSEALTLGRLQFAVSTMHMVATHPWIGWGLGSWPAVYPAFATFDPGVLVNQAHSDWLQWTAEGGLPVGLAMLSLAVWSFKPAIGSVWGIGVIAVLIHAAFDYPFSRPAIGAWPILILSMAAATQHARNLRASNAIPD
jgi:O-antigen ligase